MRFSAPIGSLSSVKIVIYHLVGDISRPYDVFDIKRDNEKPGDTVE